MKCLNILLLSSRPLPSSDSWYIFYRQMADYIVGQGVDCQLYQVCKDKGTDIPIDTYDGLFLPDEKKYNTEKNIVYLSELIKSKEINILFNFNHAIDFLKKIKNFFPDLYLFDLIHSRPDLVVQNKKAQLYDMKFSQIASFKIKLQWLFPTVYLYLLRKIVKRQMLRSYRLFDRTILLSPSYIKEYNQIIGFDSGTKIVAIPNPLPVFKESIQLDQKEKEILFVGRISVEKALYRLLYIWHRIEKKVPDWKLTIVGDGLEKSNCMQLAEALDLKNIHFEGFQNAKPYLYRASIISLVSNAEGLPMVFMEAMTMGTIPIGFNSFSAIYDMIEDGKNGIIIPAFNLDLFASRLIELMQNDLLRFELAQNAQIAVRKFDILHVGESWLNLFKSLRLI